MSNIEMNLFISNYIIKKIPALTKKYVLSRNQILMVTIIHSSMGTKKLGLHLDQNYHI